MRYQKMMNIGESLHMKIGENAYDILPRNLI